MKYKREKEGGWIQPKSRIHKIMCCDCGLVHKFEFRLHRNKIQFRVFRDNRATGQARRYLNKT